jgi:hypothetical protein
MRVTENHTHISDERSKCLDQTLDIFGDSVKPIHYRNIFEGSIAERYRTGRLDLVAELHISRHGKDCCYLAVLHVHTDSEFSKVHENFAFSHQGERLESRVAQNRDEQPMLVHVVEDMESVERVIPSSIRFCLSDEIYSPGVSTVYAPVHNGFLKSARVLRERELHNVISAAIGNDATAEMIQRRTEIVDYVTYDRCEILRDILAHANRDRDHGAWLRARLQDKSIGLSIHEIPGFTIQLTNVLLGPRSLENGSA